MEELDEIRKDNNELLDKFFREYDELSEIMKQVNANLDNYKLEFNISLANLSRKKCIKATNNIRYSQPFKDPSDLNLRQDNAKEIIDFISSDDSEGLTLLKTNGKCVSFEDLSVQSITSIIMNKNILKCKNTW